jgi:hypothetical protein
MAEYQISEFFLKKRLHMKENDPNFLILHMKTFFQFNVIKGTVDGNQFLPEYLHKNFQKIQVVKIS